MSTVRYLGIEVDDALEMAEQTEVQVSVSDRLTCRSLPARSGQTAEIMNPAQRSGSRKDDGPQNAETPILHVRHARVAIRAEQQGGESH